MRACIQFLSARSDTTFLRFRASMFRSYNQSDRKSFRAPCGISTASPRRTVSISVAPPQHLPGGAKAEGVAALGPTRLGGVTPGKSVKMRPGRFLRHEVL